MISAVAKHAVRFLTQRQLIMFGALLVVASLLVAILLVRTPLVALQALRAEAASYAAEADTAKSLRQAVAELEQKLASRGNQSGLHVQADQLMVEVLGILNRLGEMQSVELRRVSPATASKALMFEELPVEVEAMGRYQNLVRWLQEVEAALPALAINSFHMARAADASGLVMKARLAVYVDAEGKK